MDKAPALNGYLGKIADMLSGALFPDVNAEKRVSARRQGSRGPTVCSMVGLEGLEPLPALLISQSGALDNAGDWLIDSDFWLVHSRCFKKEIRDLPSNKPSWSMIMIAVDDFGGIEKVIEDFRHLRQVVPDLPVIFLTGDLDHDDFLNVRKHPCDVTMRLPITMPRLNIAICEAISNNSEWADSLSPFEVLTSARNQVDAFA